MIDITDINLVIEQAKQKNGFDTYLETIMWVLDSEYDGEVEYIAKKLNKKIVSELEIEASSLGMLKQLDELINVV